MGYTFDGYGFVLSRYVHRWSSQTRRKHCSFGSFEMSYSSSVTPRIFTNFNSEGEFMRLQRLLFHQCLELKYSRPDLTQASGDLVQAMATV